VEESIRTVRAEDPNLGIIKIAKRLGVGVSVVQRVLAA
jgi:hypothetical protein